MEQNGEFVATTKRIDMVTKELARQCEAENPFTCKCKQVLTECVFGPDARGNFETQMVTQAEAIACDRASCTCESHDGQVAYQAEAGKRLESAFDRIEMA